MGKHHVFKRSPLLEQQCVDAGLTVKEVNNTRLEDLKLFLKALAAENATESENSPVGYKPQDHFQQTEWSLMQQDSKQDHHSSLPAPPATMATPLQALPATYTALVTLLKQSDGHHRLSRLFAECCEFVQKEVLHLHHLIQNTHKHKELMNNDELTLLEADVKRRSEQVKALRSSLHVSVELLGHFVQRRQQVETHFSTSSSAEQVKARTYKMFMMYKVFKAQLDSITFA